MGKIGMSDDNGSVSRESNLIVMSIDLKTSSESNESSEDERLERPKPAPRSAKSSKKKKFFDEPNDKMKNDSSIPNIQMQNATLTSSSSSTSESCDLDFENPFNNSKLKKFKSNTSPKRSVSKNPINKLNSS